MGGEAIGLRRTGSGMRVVLPQGEVCRRLSAGQLPLEDSK